MKGAACCILIENCFHKNLKEQPVRAQTHRSLPGPKAEAGASGRPAGMPHWVADMLRQEREQARLPTAETKKAVSAADRAAQASAMARQAAKMTEQAADLARQAAAMDAAAEGRPAHPQAGATDSAPVSDGYIRFDTGILSVRQMEPIMNRLPVDLTVIDANDIVRYFSHGKERIFARTKAVVGRSVQNCHPPQSVHVVEELLNDFKAGRKDHEDFRIPFKDKFVYIRYFAIRDAAGTYLGTLEFTRNAAPIRELDGQKRILSEV